jgi:hypothetical protein
MADDFTGVPAAEWRDLRARAKNTSALLLLAWAALIVLALTLVRAGVITWADLGQTVRLPHG